ncbi:hypothetical protein AGRA3207_003459 [Actinomadura graeca]|uniref:Guanylate cyclase domain-containing protein n=1 Tax=Actinomadura graeca TaxID=2750812 RepID=A0ABX8QWA1_9ACTN|nr:hypothetical protein [Actinomadura graeca]QXJ22459.1 hypothetical protein AGRA3207_003459 [Actinomadura graeca]
MRNGSGDAGTGWTPTGHCTLFVCDIIGFGKRTDHVQGHLRIVLYEALKSGFEASGMPLDGCYQEDRGDGVIVVLPPSYDPARLAHPLPDHLRGSLRRHNDIAAEHARMRLRIALHSGPLESDANGIVGTTVNHVNRLLDAPSFKKVLADIPADLGILVSDEFYRDVIREGRGAVDPTEFRPIDVRLKETDTTAWLSVRAAPPPAGSPSGAPATVGPLPSGHTEPSGHTPPSGPGLNARHRTRQADETELPALFEIVDRLMDIPLLTTAEGRQQIVDALRKEIAIRVPRRAQPHLDIHSIVRTCLEFPEGLQEFLSLVHAYAGESSQVQALDDTVARLTRRTP